MSDYKQPDFYRFNEDSLRLVRFVSERVFSARTLLDMGAGSGIIGIELANRFKVKHLSLLEAQDDWLPFLEHNLSHFLKVNASSEILLSSFGAWNPDQTYDLIVSNPPYFLPGHGQGNRDRRKEICRSFVIDSWKIFLECISRSLAREGRAFIVIRNDERVLKQIISDVLEIRFHDQGNLVFVELLRLKKD